MKVELMYLPTIAIGWIFSRIEASEPIHFYDIGTSGIAIADWNYQENQRTSGQRTKVLNKRTSG